MFTLRHYLTALTLITASAIAMPAVADSAPNPNLVRYIASQLDQHMVNVKAEIMLDVTKVVAQTSYNAEPEIEEETLIADVTISDIKASTVSAESDIKGE